MCANTQSKLFITVQVPRSNFFTQEQKVLRKRIAVDTGPELPRTSSLPRSFPKGRSPDRRSTLRFSLTTCPSTPRCHSSRRTCLGVPRRISLREPLYNFLTITHNFYTRYITFCEIEHSDQSSNISRFHDELYLLTTAFPCWEDAVFIPRRQSSSRNHSQWSFVSV